MKFSYEEAYKIFKLENENVKISFTKFYLLRPQHMKALPKTPLMFCLCIYCANVKLKLAALNIPGLTTEYHLYNALICEKENEMQMFRNDQCIFRLCESCKHWDQTIKSIITSKGLDFSKTIKWFAWVTETSEHPKTKKISKRKALVCKSGTIAECEKELIDNDIVNPNQGFTFPQHYFTQHYQQKMFTECIDSLKEGEIICLQDFSNKITLTQQDEIKSAFYGTPQVTVHPTVIYAKLTGESDPKRIVITHLSDIKEQGADMVHYITSDCIKYLSDNFDVSWKKVYLWSDGCASQYKSKSSFFFLGKYDVDIERNFFASEHGKSESDGVTGMISKKVSNAIKSRRYLIKNAKDMLDFLSESFEKKTYIFKLITCADMQPIKDEFESLKYKVLSGNCTRKLHQIKPSGKKDEVYMIRPFSCFCPNCKNNNFNGCTNINFTKGNFNRQILPSNLTNFDNVNQADEECDDRQDDYTFAIDEDVGVEIEIKKYKLKQEYLKIDKFVIVVTKSTDDRSSKQHVARITDIKDQAENFIFVEFFKPIHDDCLKPVPDIFIRCDPFGKVN